MDQEGYEDKRRAVGDLLWTAAWGLSALSEGTGPGRERTCSIKAKKTRPSSTLKSGRSSVRVKGALTRKEAGSPDTSQEPHSGKTRAQPQKHQAHSARRRHTVSILEAPDAHAYSAAATLARRSTASRTTMAHYGVHTAQGHYGTVRVDLLPRAPCTGPE